MPIRVRCPRCSQTSEITEDLLGRQGMCNNCGAMVAIPTRLTKVCFACGKDVTSSTHRKDKDSNYLCADCWEQRKPSEQSLFSSPKVECSICHIQFALEEGSVVQGQPVCRSCAKILMAEQSEENVIPFLMEGSGESSGEDERSGIRPRPRAPVEHYADDSGHGMGLVPQSPAKRAELSAPSAIADAPPSFEDLAQLEVAPRPSHAPAPAPRWTAAPAPVARSPQVSRLPLVLSSLALAGTIILGIVQWSASRKHPVVEAEKAPAPVSDSSARATQLENETLTRLLILKAQAEVLVEVGKVKEGIGRYDALLALAAENRADNPSIAAEVDKAKSSRERAMKILAAAATQPTTAATSEDKSQPEIKKPKSIFDE